LMGSVAEGLFRHLKCPVLTIGPHVDERFARQAEIRNILYPTDLSEESKAVFPYLTSLAREYRAGIKILHVLPPETSRSPDARVLAEPLRKQLERVFGPQISPVCRPQFVIDFGHTADRILAHAHRDNVDLIGFGVRKAAEIITHFPSTVAYRVAVEAECPVLTARCLAPWK
jgi:nucleotide-binding universal stress UspA family protein